MVGFDETVMQPARRRRRRRLVIAVVHVSCGQILDVFEDATPRTCGRGWPGCRCRAGDDPGRLGRSREGYQGAVLNPDPFTGRPSPLADVQIVVDPFHVVRLANMALTRARQRVQQEALEDRGWKGDPLYDVRKLLLLGGERVDEAGGVRINTALDVGDPDDVVRDCWVAKEKFRDVYLTDHPDDAADRLDDAIAWCAAPESGPELRRLAKLDTVTVADATADGTARAAAPDRDYQPPPAR
jgi:Transposase